VLFRSPRLQSAENLSLDSVPHVLGQVSLFGKQTDREARAEVTGIGDEPFEEAKSLLEEIAGSSLGEASEQEVLHPFAAMRGNLDPRWQLPEGTTHEQARERLSTGTLNRIFKEIIGKRGPSSRLGTQAKVYYASQVAAVPPTIVLQVNKPELFTDHYQRYLLNRLREITPFQEVPIRLIFRARRRSDLNEMMHRGRQKAAAEAHKARHANDPKEPALDEADFIEAPDDSEFDGED